MKKRLIIIGVSCLFAALCVAGYFIIKSHLEARLYDAKIDGIYYKLDKTNHTATVTKIFDHEKDYTSYSGDITIPSSIKRWGKIYSVTSIESCAFAWCVGLRSVFIPNSVIEIGEDAFSLVYNVIYTGTAIGSPWGARCVNGYLEGNFVYADDTKTHLEGCCSSVIGEIKIPNSVTVIGDRTFAWCHGLTSIIIPNSVIEIDDGAFVSCSGLNSVTIPNSVTTIGNWAFADCNSLKSITIPNSVTSIGILAFMNCDNLNKIIVPCGQRKRMSQLEGLQEYNSIIVEQDL